MNGERQATAWPMTGMALMLCVSSVFTSAFLLFVLEPLITRMHLTRYGGSAAVWNTALVFFQAVLFLGYLYADRFPAWIGEQRYLLVHGFLALAPLLFLPPALHWNAVDTIPPVLAILISLSVNVGVPFFVLASNTTLVQVWYSRTSGSRDPFWLYAASNAGAILALLLYPFVIERFAGIRMQSEWWRIGYVLFLAMTLTLMLVVRRTEESSESVATVKTALSTRVRWILYSAIASSLLMSVTMALTNALGSTPLLWTVPLLLYLATFVIAFANASPRRRIIEWGSIAGIALSMASIVSALPLRVTIPGFLLALFSGALLCHRDLFESRPEAAELSSFYLAVAFGGFAGGVFNAIVAPLLFKRISEFPVTLAAVAVLIDAGLPWRENFSRERLRKPGVLFSAGTMLLMIIVTYFVAASEAAQASPLRASLLLGLLLFGVLLGRHRGHFAVAVLLMTLFLLTGRTTGASTIREERSFFGVSSVVHEGHLRIYRHGGIIHGAEMDPPREGISTSYFHPASPIAATFARVPRDGRIGILGLGAGTVAVLTKDQQRVDFFEIDPTVERIAREEFSFLARGRGKMNIETGDGRLLVAGKPDRTYDLLFVDAFSGGAIPLHLITAEALELYLRKCKPDGVVLLHVSSRAVAFDRVLRGWSRATGVPVLAREFRPTPQQFAEGAQASNVAAIASSDATRAALLRDGWVALGSEGRSVLWTDDHASAISVLNFRFW